MDVEVMFEEPPDPNPNRMARGAFEAAPEYLDRALSLLDATRSVTPTQRCRLLLKLGDALTNAGARNRAREVLQRHFDERRRTKDRRVNRDAGQGRLEILQRRFDVAGDLKRIGAELLFNNQQQAGPVVDDRIADRLWKSFNDGRDVANSQGCAISCGDDDRFQITRLLYRGGVRDREPLIGSVEEAAGLQRDRFSGGPHDLVDGDAVRLEPMGVDEHL